MGEHKLPRDLANRARDLSNLRVAAANPAPAEDAWCPVRPAYSCASCFWNWTDDIIGTNPVQRRPSCHLLPRQMGLTSNDQLAAMLPGFGPDPSKELCSGWKSREIPDAIEPGSAQAG